mgnify:CR=1 FL=1
MKNIEIPSRLKVKKNDPFLPLYTSKKRYFFLTGGRGSLKSSSVHKFVALLTFQKGHGILFTRYTMSSAEASIIPEFKIVTDRLKITDDFHFTKTKVINKHTGSFIFFSGIKTSQGNQTAKLKSIAGISTWVIEEGEDFDDPIAFDTIDNSIRTTAVQNRVIWIQNPTTKEHFIYEKFIEGNSKKIKVENYDVTVSNHNEVEHIHTTYRIAEKEGYLDATWLQKAANLKLKALEDEKNAKKKDKNHVKHTSKYYYVYIGGWLEMSEGAIYTDWIQGKFNTKVPSVHGMDYGYFPDPLALIEVAVVKKEMKIYVREKIFALKLSESEIIEAIRKKIGNKNNLIVADTNEPRTTSAIRKAGFNIVSAKKEKGSVKADIIEIQDYQIIVDPKSENIKRELRNYSWNNKKASIPIGEYNHTMDAIRYSFRRQIKKKRRGIKRRN